MQQMTRTLCSQIGFSASDFTELNENLAYVKITSL